MDNIQIQIIERLMGDGSFREAADMLGMMIAGLVAQGEPTAGTEDARTLADLYFRHGKLLWRLGDRSGATSDYAKAVALDASSPALKALEQARAVADFFNPDLYNP